MQFIAINRDTNILVVTDDYDKTEIECGLHLKNIAADFKKKCSNRKHVPVSVYRFDNNNYVTTIWV